MSKKNKTASRPVPPPPQAPEVTETGSEGTLHFPIWMKVILFLFMGYHLAVVGYMAHNRFSYSAYLDGQEDIHARSAQTMALGESLYGPVNVKYQRMVYTPLAFWVQSKVIKYIGVDIRYQRAVAFIFGLGAIILVGACVKQLTGSRFWGFMGACMMAGIDVDIWYIHVSPQAFHVFFAFLGLYILLRDPAYSIRTLILATIAFFLSFYSKQTGVIYIAAFVMAVFMQDRKKGLLTGAASGVLVVGSILYLTSRPDSDFWRLCFVVHMFDPIFWERLWTDIIFPEMSGRLGVPLAIVLACLFTTGRKNWTQWFKPHFLLMLVGLAGGNYARMKFGSGNDQVIIGYGALILVALVLLHQYMTAKKISVALTAGLLVIASVAQFHSVSKHVILPDDQARFDYVVNTIRNSPGKVKMFVIGYMNVIAGKEAFTDPFIDGVKRQREGVLTYNEMWTDYLATVPWDTVLVGIPMEYNSSLMRTMLEQHYQVRETIPKSGRPGGFIRREIVVLDKKQSSR